MRCKFIEKPTGVGGDHTVKVGDTVLRRAVYGSGDRVVAPRFAWALPGPAPHAVGRARRLGSSPLALVGLPLA